MKTFREKYLDENLEIDFCKISRHSAIKSKWRDTKSSWRWTQYILVNNDTKNISKYFESGELIFISESLNKIFITDSNQYIHYQFKARLKGTNRHFWFIATRHCLVKYILNDEQKLLFEIGEL